MSFIGGPFLGPYKLYTAGFKITLTAWNDPDSWVDSEEWFD